MTRATFSIELKTITPVHIGSGHELNGNFEYLYFPQERCVAVIDAEKIMDIIGEDHLDKWVSAIELKQNILQVLPMLKEKKAADLAERVIHVEGEVPDATKNAIKEQLFLGTEKRACIPGSSLKGSVRTAFLTKLIRENPAFVQNDRNLKDRRGKFKDREVITEYLAKDLWFDRKKNRQVKRFSPNKDLFRFLRISDFLFAEKTVVVKAEVANLFRHGWGIKGELSSFWECIPAGSTSQGNIQIPATLIERVKEKRYIQSDKLDLIELKKLFALINKHTIHLVQREMDFWEEEGNPEAIGELLEILQKVEQLAQEAGPETCVLRVGAGSGWEFMTGAWPADKDLKGEYILDDDTWIAIKRQIRRKNYPDDMIFPKSRKLIGGGLPLGFVQLSLV